MSNTTTLPPAPEANGGRPAPWPCARITVKDDAISNATLYAPGLPDGEFDVWLDAEEAPAQPAPSVEAAGAEVDAFLAEVRAELIRARNKFPGDRIMTIALAEEFGELCKAVLDESSARVRKEAVQTAVMACRVAVDGDGSVIEWRRQKGLDPINRSAVEALARGEQP